MKTALIFLMIFSLSESFSIAQTVQTDGTVTGQIICYLIDSPDNYYVGTTEGIFRSSDKGSSWVAVNLKVTNVRSLAMVRTTMFAGTDGGGVFVSTNSGENWKAAGDGMSNKNVLSLAAGDASVFAGTRNGGIFMTENGGESWKEISEGIPRNANIYALASVGRTLYAGSQLGVFSSPDAMVRWSILPEK